MVDLSYRTAHVKFRGRKCEIITECFREWRVHAVTSHHSFTLVRGLKIYWHSPCNPGASTSFLTVLSCHFASPLLSYVSLSQTQSDLSLDKPSLHLCWFQFQVTLSQWLELQAVWVQHIWLLWPSFFLHELHLSSPSANSGLLFCPFLLLYWQIMCVLGVGNVCILCLCSLIVMLFKALWELCTIQIKSQEKKSRGSLVL